MHYFSPAIVGLPSLYAALSTRNPNWYYTTHKWEFNEVLTALAVDQPKSLLEVGCGYGNFLGQSARFCEAVTGLEFNPDALNECQVKGLDVRNCRISELTEKFDVIVSFQVFEHVENPGQLFAECVDRLAPNGRLVLAVPNQDGVLGGIEKNCLNLPPHHVTLWEKSCFEHLAVHHSLVLERYTEEPISFELYSAHSFGLLDKVKVTGGIVAKIYNRVMILLHRAILPLQFEGTGRNLPGHTHIAFFRKQDAK